ncbi:ATP-binding protein [Brevundimonas sp.]|uniref:AlbA family DNA-binding domain-containing protein n=1 Tax=Brevundimonas sp. TaxID=1871086 RepID=UPI002D29D3C1|nr:ATP-binding protein [Brevundimonas sp.]HYC97025.1 ATP-binding protein [Brevundimonas sp.]
MATYTPFQRPLEDLTVDDLSRLTTTSEGWYVEYKREVPNATSIAKSISALANTYGGWLFYGVEEASKDNSVAGSFPGVPTIEMDANLQRIRQAVAGHLNPSPHFDVKVLTGPHDGGLAADRGVICIYVPRSFAAPHVHRSGQIYRRVGDGSEPRPENDRHLLDQLFRRGDELRKDFETWVERDPEFSKGEEEAPYLRLMMVTDPWRDEDPWLEIDSSELREIFNVSRGVVSSVPFETLYTSANGFIARQVNVNDPHNLGLTWRFRQTLVSDVIVPLNFYAVDQAWRLEEHLEGYEQASSFIASLERRNYASPRVVDLNMLFNLLVGVVEIQRRLLARAGWTKPYYIKARLLNVWRTVPFLDIRAVLDRFEAFGLPLCLDEKVTTPPGTGPESFDEIPPFEDVESESVRVLLQTLALFTPIARAWGLPEHLGPDVQPPYFTQLQQAGIRAIAVQDRKNAAHNDG